MVNEKRVDIFRILETKIQREDFEDAVRGFEDWAIINKSNSEPKPDLARNLFTYLHTINKIRSITYSDYCQLQTTTYVSRMVRILNGQSIQTR